MARSVAVVALASLVALPSCSRKLTQEDCNHLLGRGVGLAAYKQGQEPLQKEMGIYGGVPVDVEYLRKNARGPAKQAIDDFDRACIGAKDDGDTVPCARRANNDEQFVACGGMVKRAREAGEIARLALPRKHSVDQCAKYAQHAVEIRAATADDVSKLVKECEDWLEVGFYECRLAAKDVAAWKACENP